MTTRRFPPPCSAEVTPNCFIVRDADGQQLAYVYFEDEPGRRSAAKLRTKDEARWIAVNIATELLGRPRPGSDSRNSCNRSSSAIALSSSSVEFEVSRAMKDSDRWALVSFSAMSAESKAKGVSSLTFSGIGEFISVSTL